MDEDNKLGIFSNDKNFSERLKIKFKENYLDVEIFDNLNSKNLSEFNYLILDFIKDTSGLYRLGEIVGNTNSRIIILVSQYVGKSEKLQIETYLNNLISINPNLGIILTPEILGDGVTYNENYLSHIIIRQSLISEKIKVVGEVMSINTISLNRLLNRVVKETFSFGIAGQILLLNGLKKKTSVFITKYVGVNFNNVIYTKSDYPLTEITPTNAVNIDFSLRLAVKNTLKTFSKLSELGNLNTNVKITDKIKNADNKQVLLPESIFAGVTKKTNHNKSSKLSKQIFKKFSLIIVTFLLILLTPLLLIFTSLGSLYLAYETVENKNGDISYKLIKTSSVLSQTSKNLSFGIPIYYNFSNLLLKTSSLGEEVLLLANLSKEFVSNITGDKIYDFEFYSNGISASLDRIHTDIGFLQSDINEQDGYFGNYIRNILNSRKINVSVIRNEVYEFKNLTSRISNLLGLDSPKKYLILFQNNMELRPTGGFIGSFAIMSFDKGRLTEIVVNDVYSADGQLKGHVDPPGPILKYLGEGGWYLRDANWDPDFKNTASKVEWFLDKEIDQKVDGVIAIDLFFIQSLLKITGPITLVDFKKTVDENNLYQTTQSEVESEFFPGSIKKASFLTSLSRNLITEVENLPSSKYILFFKEIYKSLEERHIQIFLHDTNSQNAISELGFSGEIDTNTDCGERCVLDNYSLIDANLGINKANYFVSRSQEVKLQVNKDFINHEVIVDYNNSASNSIGAPGLYKSYTRLLIPVEASIVSVKVNDLGGEYRDLEYDLEEINSRKEIGFLLEIFPSTSKKIKINWILPNTKLKEGGEYRLLVRKQAGTDGDRLKINVSGVGLSLTGKALPVYNTTLAKDFSARLFFK